MAEQTKSSIEIAATPAEVMAVIADFSAYPEWVQGMKNVSVVSEVAGKAEKVYFELDQAPIKDAYTLQYQWSDNQLSWTLIEGRMLKAMSGSYSLAEIPGGTEVTYQLAVDLAIPIIGMLRRKAEKVIVDTALKGLKKRVEAN